MRRTILAIMAAGALLGACGDKSVAGPDDGAGADTLIGPSAEGRALWISRYDWNNEAELLALIDSAAAANFNIIYFQARGRSDAYYTPGLEPWGERKPTFVLGRYPGWDPLWSAAREAKSKGMQLHVWINALIGWCSSDPIPETTPRHILLDHPEWQMRDQAGGTSVDACNFLTPGDPGVRTWVSRVSADIVRRYNNVDGIHLDYIRYPYPTWSYDTQTVNGYNRARVNAPGLTFEQHRRNMVTLTVREIRDSIRAVRPRVVLSAAVWGIYQNGAGWSSVATGYEARFQDSRGWLQDGSVDVIAPMIYWPIQSTYGAKLDFAWLADDFANHAFNRHVYIGMGAPLPEESFCNTCDVVRQIYRARRSKPDGVVVYNGRIVRDKHLWGALRSGPFQKKATVPVMSWLP